jgi:hypothetical protein
MDDLRENLAADFERMIRFRLGDLTSNPRTVIPLLAAEQADRALALIPPAGEPAEPAAPAAAPAPRKRAAPRTGAGKGRPAPAARKPRGGTP